MLPGMGWQLMGIIGEVCLWIVWTLFRFLQTLNGWNQQNSYGFIFILQLPWCLMKKYLSLNSHTLRVLFHDTSNLPKLPIPFLMPLQRAMVCAVNWITQNNIFVLKSALCHRLPKQTYLFIKHEYAIFIFEYQIEKRQGWSVWFCDITYIPIYIGM